jgi:nucleotide-binding universal stress UspA family protein
VIDHVILAVDGEPANTAAIDWVIDRSDRIPAKIEVTTVLEEVPLAEGFPDVERDRREGHVQALAQRIRDALPDSEAIGMVRHGRPEHELIEASADADLLVVGMRRPDRFDALAHLPLGLRLAGRTHCALVVVPERWLPVGSGIVVGWDGDATTDVAVAFAMREARRSGQQLTIVHADDSPRIPPEVDAIVRRSRFEQGLDIRYAPVSGPVAAAVLDAARGASLVVVGSHARNTFEDLMLGSVSEDVLAHSALPVAVTPAQVEPIVVSPEILEEDL